jgi:hypothetical protein
MTGLTAEETTSIKKSFLNILGLVLESETLESRYVRCLLKWGFQLQVNPEDLRQAGVDFSNLAFSAPDKNVARLEAIYHLVHMICLDQVVEDVELELAAMYAEKLGFKPTLVGDLLKSIVTADGDGQAESSIREQVMDFLKLYSHA